MSDILDFVVKNFAQLRLADYFVLAVFGVLVGGASFVALRWLFSARFQAQKELLELQAQTVGALTSHLDLTKQERDSLRKELEEKMRQLAEIEKKDSTPDIEKVALREQALVLASQGLIPLLHRMALAYELLFYTSRSLPKQYLQTLSCYIHSIA